MTRKKIIPLFLLVAMALPFVGSAKSAQLESRWQVAPLKIDGDIGDWLSPAFQIEKDVQVHYAFCNDTENLCLVFIFKDKNYLSSLSRTGLTVWFSDPGKKKKQLGLRLDKKTLSASTLIAVMEKKSGPLSDEKKKEMLSKPAYIINQFTAADTGNAVLPSMRGPKHYIFWCDLTIAAGAK